MKLEITNITEVYSPIKLNPNESFWYLSQRTYRIIPYSFEEFVCKLADQKSPFEFNVVPSGESLHMSDKATVYVYEGVSVVLEL